MRRFGIQPNIIYFLSVEMLNVVKIQIQAGIPVLLLWLRVTGIRFWRRVWWYSCIFGEFGDEIFELEISRFEAVRLIVKNLSRKF